MRLAAPLHATTEALWSLKDKQPFYVEIKQEHRKNPILELYMIKEHYFNLNCQLYFLVSILLVIIKNKLMKSIIPCQ